MPKKLLWRYLLSVILDSAIMFAGGAMVIAGWASYTKIQSYEQRMMLSAVSALIWIVWYSIYVPYVSNGQTFAKKLLKVGCQFNKPMKLMNVFIVNAVASYVFLVITWGISLIVNAILVIYTQKGLTIEERFYPVSYYDTRDKTHKNYTNSPEDKAELAKLKQKKLHKNSKKKKRK